AAGSQRSDRPGRQPSSQKMRLPGAASGHDAQVLVWLAQVRPVAIVHIEGCEKVEDLQPALAMDGLQPSGVDDMTGCVHRDGWPVLTMSGFRPELVPEPFQGG